MLVHREVVLAKTESNYNVDAVPTDSANAILVENISMKSANVRMIERQAVRQSLAPLKQVYGGQLVELTFDVELKGSGTAGTAPELGVLLRACGMSELVSASTSVAYSPVSSDHESATFHYYQDGKLTIVTGARGTFSATIKAGETGKLSFTFTGHMGVRSDTLMASPTYSSIVPAVALGINFTVGGYAAQIDALNFDISNEISTPASISSADGYGEIRISKRDVSGSIDPETQLIGTKDYFTEWVNGTDSVLTTNTIGTSAGNQIAISMPAIHYRDIGDGDREGIRTQDSAFGASEVLGDDEITFLFT